MKVIIGLSVDTKFYYSETLYLTFIFQNRGEVNQEMKDKYDQANTTFQKLLVNTETMADLLEQPMPELPVEGQIDFLQ